MDYNAVFKPNIRFSPQPNPIISEHQDQGSEGPELKRVKTAIGGRKVAANPPDASFLTRDEGDIVAAYEIRKKRKKHERYTTALVNYELKAVNLEKGEKIGYGSISHHELMYTCVQQEFDKDSVVYKRLSQCCVKGFEFDGSFDDFIACVKQINSHVPEDTVLAALERDSWKGLVTSNALNTKHKFMVLILCCLPRYSFWEDKGVARQIMQRGWKQSRKNPHGRVPRNVSAFMGKFYKLRGNSHRMFDMVLSRQSFYDIDPRVWGPNMIIRLLILYQQEYKAFYTEDAWIGLMNKVLDPKVLLPSNFLSVKLQNENWIEDISGRAYVDWFPPPYFPHVAEELQKSKVEQMRREASRMASSVDINYSGLPQLLKDELSRITDPESKLAAVKELASKAKGLIALVFKLRQQFERRFANIRKFNDHAYVQICTEGSQHFSTTVEFWHHILLEYCGYNWLRATASREVSSVGSVPSEKTQDIIGRCNSAPLLEEPPSKICAEPNRLMLSAATQPAARTHMQDYRAVVDLKAIQAENVSKRLSKVINEMLVFTGSFESIKPDSQSLALFRHMLNVYTAQIESIRREMHWCRDT